MRAYHEIRALAGAGHAVHLLAFADDGCAAQHRSALGQWCASVEIVPLDRRRATVRALARLPGPAPLSLAFFGSARMRNAVERRIRLSQPQAIMVCSSAMAQYAPPELASRTIVDLVDADSEKWRDYARRAVPPRAWVYWLEWRRLRRYEQHLLGRVGHVVVTSEREAACLDPVGRRRGRLHVITNGVDLDYFKPEPSDGLSTVPRLVFTGAMDYAPNIDGVRYFAREVLPAVRHSYPATEFLVVGRRPTGAVRELGSRPGVQIVGEVPDVRPYLIGATGCVVPLRIARGVQNKLLEAMACGQAVIATPQAADGLRVVDGEHLLVARADREQVSATLRALGDVDLRARLGRQARQFVEREHRWSPHMRRLTELVESAAAA